MDTTDTWMTAKDLLLSGGSLGEISKCILQLPSEKIETFYENGWNLLHHAISRNRKDFTEFLFMNGYFLPPHESTTLPYCHMACAYGHKDIVESLLKFGQNCCDIKLEPCDIYWNDFIAKLSKDKEELGHIQEAINRKKYIMTFDIAGFFGHKHCLLALLTVYDEDIWLGKLSACDQDMAVGLLLKSQIFDVNSLNYGFEVSLYAVVPSCLKLMLEYAAEHNVNLLQKHPFHFMYTYGLDSSTLPGNSLECTRLLIKHGWDVNTMFAPSSLALYSLFHSVADSTYTCYELDLTDELKCLKELLAAGANPNYNEFNFEDANPANEHETDLQISPFEYKLMAGAGARPTYCSATDVIVDFMGNFNVDHIYVIWNFLANSLALLVLYDCDISDSNLPHINSMSLLHQTFSRIGATLCTDEDLAIEVLQDMRKMIDIMLTNGADLHSKDCVNRTPLTLLLQAFLGGLNCWSDDIYEDEWPVLTSRIIPFFKYLNAMRSDEVRNFVAVSAIAVDDARTTAIPFSFTDNLKQSLYSYLGGARSLYQSCLLQVWYASGCKVKNIMELKLPYIIEQHLNELFSA